MLTTTNNYSAPFLFNLLICLTAYVCPIQAKQPSSIDNQTSISKPTNHKSSENQQIDRQIATFAGGCFWCMEPPFDKLKGVISTTSGYTDGHKKNPSYREVSSGHTGHTEAVQIVFDANQISYQELLEVFWKNIDPTAKNQQFCDKGSQYRSGIFYHNKIQKQLALQSRQKLINSKKFTIIHTQIKRQSTFYPAEEYHQDYYRKNPIRYKYYRYACGRDKRLKELWNSPDN